MPRIVRTPAVSPVAGSPGSLSAPPAATQVVPAALRRQLEELGRLLKEPLAHAGRLADLLDAILSSYAGLTDQARGWVDVSLERAGLTSAAKLLGSEGLRELPSLVRSAPDLVAHALGLVRAGSVRELLDAVAKLAADAAFLPPRAKERLQSAVFGTALGKMLSGWGLGSIEELSQLAQLGPSALGRIDALRGARTALELAQAARGLLSELNSLPLGIRERLETGLLSQSSFGWLLAKAGLDSFSALSGAADALLSGLQLGAELASALAARPPEVRRLASLASQLSAQLEALPPALRVKLDAVAVEAGGVLGTLGVKNAHELAKLAGSAPALLVRICDLGAAVLAGKAVEAGEHFEALLSELERLPAETMVAVERLARTTLLGEHRLGEVLRSAGIESVAEMVQVARAGARVVRAASRMVQSAVAGEASGSLLEAAEVLRNLAALPAGTREKMGRAFESSAAGKRVLEGLGFVPGLLGEALRASPHFAVAAAGFIDACNERNAPKAFTAAGELLGAVDAAPELKARAVRSLARSALDAIGESGEEALRRLSIGLEDLEAIFAAGPRALAALGEFLGALLTRDAGTILRGAATFVQSAASSLPAAVVTKLVEGTARQVPVTRHLMEGVGGSVAAGLLRALANPVLLAELSELQTALLQKDYARALRLSARLGAEALRGNPELQSGLLRAVGLLLPGKVGSFLRDSVVVDAFVGAGTPERVLNLLEAACRGDGSGCVRELALAVRDLAFKDNAPNVEGMKALAKVAQRFVAVLPAAARGQIQRLAEAAAKRNLPLLGWAISGAMAVPDAIQLARMLASGRATPEEIAFKVAELGLDIAGAFGPAAAAVASAGGLVLGLLRVVVEIKKFAGELFAEGPGPARPVEPVAGPSG